MSRASRIKGQGPTVAHPGPGTNTGSKKPPGWHEIKAQGHKPNNGHLQPKPGGGDGKDLRNLVPQYDHVNSPYIRDGVEGDIRDSLEAGNPVALWITPRHGNADSGIPTTIEYNYRDLGTGVSKHCIVHNQPRAVERPGPATVRRSAMTTDHVQEVISMLGPPQETHADPEAWRTLEDRLGLRLPDSFKALTDMYAPVLLNEHLFLKHPATARRNLGAFIDSTITAFRRSRSAEREGHLFGGPDGLVPLLGTDRGEYLFFASGATSGGERLVASNGDEPVLYDYRVDFAEWLHRYLIGEPMFGPGSEAFYEGPVVLESMPLKEGDEVRVWYGPDRGM